jgi:hypothetical protein
MFVYEFIPAHGWLNYTKIVQRYENFRSWALGVGSFFLPLHQNQHKYKEYENEILTVPCHFHDGTWRAGQEIS